MNTKVLASHYARLTPEERFRLMVAAHDRRDDAEAVRLVNAGSDAKFVNKDYSPYAHALRELAEITFMELMEEAARHHGAFDHGGMPTT